MRVRRIERFGFDGREFDTLSKLKIHAENELGGIIDKIRPNHARLPPATKRAIFETLVANRQRLVELLSAEFDHDDFSDDLQTANCSVSVFEL